jgi:glucoamylase
MLLKAVYLHLSTLSTFLSLAHGIPSRQVIEKRAELDTWITNESPIAYSGILANFGASGAKAYGAASGVLLASPSKTNPDCEHFAIIETICI